MSEINFRHVHTGGAIMYELCITFAKCRMIDIDIYTQPPGATPSHPRG